MNFEILYTYIKAIIYDNQKYAMNFVDSLTYSQNDFFSAIQNNLLLEDELAENTETINLFCLCVSKEKSNYLKSSLLKDILENLSYSNPNNKTCNTSSNLYNQYIAICANYLSHTGLNPLVFSFETNDLVIFYILGSTNYSPKPPENVKEILNIWYEKDMPSLFGKQILTQPFFYKTLLNRKTLDIIPSHTDNDLYLLLEGNLKIRLDYSSISILDYNDTSCFNSTDIQRIVYNPIYCFGYTFEPDVIFLDWFDVYLYAMALLDIDLDNSEKLKDSYFAFLDFIDNHICEKVYADKSFFEPDFFFSILKINIQHIKQFIRL